MIIRRLSIFFPVAAAAAILSGCAAHGPGPFDNPVNLLGAPVSDRVAVESSQRTITITPETRYINVTSGETIRFIVAGQSFAWSFQIGPTITKFDLNQIAPPGLLTGPIAVYVAPNPLYISNS